jgi:hypothetical protein
MIFAIAVAASTSIASFAAQAQAASGSRAALAVLPFSFLDTTGEPRDQKAEHAARLAAVGEQLRTGLGSQFRIVALAGSDTSCQPGDSACILARARQSGADIVLAGAVHKASTMLTRMWVGAFDVSTGKRLFYRDLNFRGDNDESYRRATAFLVGEIESNPLKTP